MKRRGEKGEGGKSGEVRQRSRREGREKGRRRKEGRTELKREEEEKG